ncbi:ABC transporter ATP-binding protein [Rhabdaerophilum calidifontis]|uniref:ABC transporter ATP-binding protein n=1 Tax=Rhabdaerophilum calidifontis TaxID=2604328 RepID=UPI00123BC1F1|nr:ABC transporter ATP-binding protein [Rhabdaerophilum calidifontis]
MSGLDLARDAAPLVAIRDLAVRFNGVPALRGVDLHVARGEAVGLVGESGSGKSVTWLAALGLLPGSAAISGSVTLEGTQLLGAPAEILDRTRGGRVAMIFQDPASALNPVLTIGRQIGEALALHRGLSGRENAAEARRLLELVGIPDAGRRLSAYPHEFSGGQNQRVMIAMALAGGPDLLVADEPTTALDATIQSQILNLIGEIRRETGMALVLISHDLGVVAETCDRIAVMYAGRIVEEAPADQLFLAPRHPYTRGLIGALPPIEGARRRLVAIPGTVPDPRAMPPGCAFAPRCTQAHAACDRIAPALEIIGPGRRVACLAETAGRGSAPTEVAAE